MKRGYQCDSCFGFSNGKCEGPPWKCPGCNRETCECCFWKYMHCYKCSFDKTDQELITQTNLKGYDFDA